MNKEKIFMWVIPALLLSCLTFELMPGSVQYFSNNVVVVPETAWNFFAPPSEGMASSCLILAGTVTVLAAVLALVAACFQKRNLYKSISWASLIASALAAVPYMVGTEEEMLRPNVVVLLLSLVSWLLARAMDKKKDGQKEVEPSGRHL